MNVLSGQMRNTEIMGLGILQAAFKLYVSFFHGRNVWGPSTTLVDTQKGAGRLGLDAGIERAVVDCCAPVPCCVTPLC